MAKIIFFLPIGYKYVSVYFNILQGYIRKNKVPSFF